MPWRHHPENETKKLNKLMKTRLTTLSFHTSIFKEDGRVEIIFVIPYVGFASSAKRSKPYLGNILELTFELYLPVFKVNNNFSLK